MACIQCDAVEYQLELVFYLGTKKERRPGTKRERRDEE